MSEIIQVEDSKYNINIMFSGGMTYELVLDDTNAGRCGQSGERQTLHMSFT